MNKFAAIILLALVASASCLSLPGHNDKEFDNEMSQAEGDSDSNPETDLLLGTQKTIFSGFCVDQRDQILKDIKDFTAQTSAKITKIFFGEVNGITDEVLNVEKNAVKELAEQLAKPNTEITENLSEDQIQQLIQNAKIEIQKKDSVAGVIPAAKAAVAAALGAANSAILTRLAQARKVIGSIKLYQQFKTACEKVADYEKKMTDDLESVKQGALAEADSDDVKQIIESTTIFDLNCATPKNIVRLHGFCDVILAGQQYFFKVLGMASPLEQA